MKRHYFLIPCAVLPYLAILTLLVFLPAKEIALAICGLALLLCLIISLPSTIIYSARCISERAPAREVAKANMILKLIHIPAYIIIFLLALVLLVTIFTFWMSILFAMLDLYLIIQTGIVGAVASKQTCGEGKMSTTASVLCGIAQFIYCVDVAAAVILYVKQKNKVKN